MKRLFAIAKDYPHRSSLTHFFISVRNISGIACGGSFIEVYSLKNANHGTGRSNSELRPQVFDYRLGLADFLLILMEVMLYSKCLVGNSMDI